MAKAHASVLRILGVDPGFAACGVAILEYHPQTQPLPLVTQVAVLRTEKSGKKRQILASDDNVERARLLVRLMLPYLDAVDVIAAESMSFARHASASHKVGITWGVIAALAETKGMAIVQASPQDVKKKISGERTASKGDVQLAVAGSASFTVGATATLRDMGLGIREHAYDAIASGLAVLDGDVVRAMARAVRS